MNATRKTLTLAAALCAAIAGPPAAHARPMAAEASAAAHPRGGVAAAAEKAQGIEKAGPNCNAAYMASLDPASLLAFVLGEDYDCLRPLFAFGADAAAVASEANVGVFAADVAAASADVATHVNRIRQGLTFLHAAFYQEYYRAEIAFSNAARQDAIDALLQVAASPAFLNTSAALASMRAEWCAAMDSMGGSLVALAVYQSILARYNAGAALDSDYDERRAVYCIVDALAWNIEENAALGAASPWYAAVGNGLTNQVAAIAVNTAYDPGAEYVVNNAIWTLGQFSALQGSTATLAHNAVGTAFQNHPDMSYPWAWAYIVLRDFFGAIEPGVGPLDTAAIEGGAHLAKLGATSLTYELGRIALKSKLSTGEADVLYNGLQQVESHFFRLCGRTTPQANDTNAKLDIVLFENANDYDAFTPLIFHAENVPGGTYDESSGHVYTFERTGDYTTLDGVAHEFVHHLDARYNVAGFWGGSGVLHGDARFVWWWEGLAECLAGSTRAHGLLTREVDGKTIDASTYDYTVDELVHWSDEESVPFAYLSLLFYYLQAEAPATLRGMIDAVQSGNAAALEAAADAAGADAQLQSAWGFFVDAARTNYQGSLATYSDAYPAIATPALPSDNAAALEAAIGGVLTPVAPKFYNTPERFHYFDTVTRTVAGPANVARQQLQADFQTLMDAVLLSIAPQAANFEPAVAWFANLEVNGTAGTALVCIEGPYAGSSAWNGFHSADTLSDHAVSLSELLRVIQFYNSGSLHCDAGTEDGFSPGGGGQACAPHQSDYNTQNWAIALTELLRLIQFYNAGGYYPDFLTEDGFAPGYMG